MFALLFFLIALPQPSGAANPLASLSGIDVFNGKAVPFAPAKKSKGVVLVFLSAECPCSQSHEADLKKLSEEFPDFKFIGINSNTKESTALVRNHFSKSQFNFPIVRDQNTKLADQFGALKTPHVFLFSAQGELLFKGGIDDSRHANNAKEHFLRNALVAVQAGKVPDPKEVRTLGCAIDR